MNLSLISATLFSVACAGQLPAESATIDQRIAAYFQPPAELANDFGSFRSPLLLAEGRKVANAAEWRQRRTEILKTWHEFLGPWPPLLEKPKLEYLDDERRDNVTQHHVRIEVAPARLTDDAYILIPDGNGPFPAVLVVYYDAKTGIGRGKAELRDFAWQLARRGFVTLSLGSAPASFFPDKEHAQLQPLSYHAYVAANCHTILAGLRDVDPQRIGVVGHSYGGKWAMFASCLYEKFACAAWSDGGIVFDEKRGNVNYWEPWYIGHEPGRERKPGIPTDANPRTGPYHRLIETGHDLHELHALMAPRPFLVSGGAEDRPERWTALNHTIAVNKLLGYEHRVAMTNRAGHPPTPESNEQIYLFFEQFLKHESIGYRPAAAFLKLPDSMTLGPCSGVDVDSRGNVYVIQRKSPPILCFDSSGKLQRAWGTPLIGRDPQMQGAHGIRIDAEDNVWITDRERHLVRKFDKLGQLLLTLGTEDKPGTGENQFNRPTDVAFGKSGEVYVADGYGNSRVMKFDRTGKFLTMWGTKGTEPGQFDLPHTIAVGPDGRVYVGDRYNSRIQIFDGEGKLKEIWPGFVPCGIAFDRAGRLFVADGVSKILQIDGRGNIVKSWGMEAEQLGLTPGQRVVPAIANPGGLRFVPHLISTDAQGNLYLADVSNQMLHKLDRIGAKP